MGSLDPNSLYASLTPLMSAYLIDVPLIDTLGTGVIPWQPS